MHEAFESYKFHLRKQEPSENIQTYLTTLRQLAKNYNFGQLRDYEYFLLNFTDIFIFTNTIV